jgi:mRNA interferase MazF
MTIYDQGNVVLVPFPFTDLTTTKRRPAPIVSAGWFNRQREDCILVAITSQIPLELSRDELALSDADLKSAGLPKPSIVKAGKIVTIDQNLIVKTLGALPPATLSRVLDQVQDVLSR